MHYLFNSSLVYFWVKDLHIYHLTKTFHFKETQMTETQIGGIIELTSKDPNFESLFNLFQGKSLTEILCNTSNVAYFKCETIMF